MLRRRQLTSSVLTCCIAVLTACIHQRASGDFASSNLVITELELDASRTASVYDAIKKLRGNFLTYRGETSLQASRSQPYPTVFLDGVQFGELGELRRIPTSQVARVQLLRSWEATTRYGTGFPSGVIEVTTKR